MARQRRRIAWLGSALAVVLLVQMIGISQGDVAAQDTPSADSTVVVTGFGSATAAATSAQVQVILGSSVYSETPLTRADMAPYIAAITAAGIPEEAVEVAAISSMYSSFGPGGGQLRFEVYSPTRKSMTTLVQSLYDAAAEPGSSVQIAHVGVRYLTNDCEALQQEAVAAAIEDGWQRGERMALALDSELGTLSKAEESTQFGYSYADSCTPSFPGSMNNIYGPGVENPFDPTAPVEAAVYATVVLTFTLQPSGPATPES